MLISCYKQSLALAREYGCRTVAFPLISAGVYGYPKQEALRTAVETIRQFLQEQQCSKEEEMTVYVVVFSSDILEIAQKSGLI